MGMKMFFAALLISQLMESILAEEKCNITGSRDLSLVLRSRRNVTGHWNLEVTLTQYRDSNREYREAGPVVMQLDQNNHFCDNKETVITTAILSTPPPLAGPGYQFYPGIGRYKLHTTKVNWEMARLTCLKEGAHLAVINSQEEADVLAKMYRRHQSDATYVAFLGFYDHTSSKEFLTIFDQTLESTGYLKWSPSEPHGSNCGCMYPSGLICDVDCTDALSFFCEQELF